MGPITVAAIMSLLASPGSAPAQAADDLPPIVYAIEVADSTAQTARVTVNVPVPQGRDSVELMMPVWSPGYYVVENYAKRIDSFEAKAPDGTPLEVEKPSPNHWTIATKGQNPIVFSYVLTCKIRSVTGNWIGTDFAVWNGPATFVTLADEPTTTLRPHLLRVKRPEGWERSCVALDRAPGEEPDSYVAPTYDTLADSPILVGTPTVYEFTVDGVKHALVEVGSIPKGWDGARAASDVEAIVRATARFWGKLPFDRPYLFLNPHWQGNGGLEHAHSTLLSTSPRMTMEGPGYPFWLGFVSHEYFHAFNVKRLRPVEISTFDYAAPPQTASLWISEGLTSYFGELMVARSGVVDPSAHILDAMSREIRSLQNTPGRLAQTLAQSSLEVWNGGTSGVGRDPSKTVSYYVKGPVVGFLLDAEIRRATDNDRSLDDVMRLAFERYSGATGFTPDQFREAAEEVSKTDLKPFFHKALDTTEELDYQPALDWFGLRFAPRENDDDSKVAPWTLEVSPDATDAQKARWKHLTTDGERP
jgi:predicted metalloprotease with PDZ domain